MNPSPLLFRHAALLAAAAMLLSGLPVVAQTTYSWNSAGAANWNAAGSWTPAGGPPTAGDSIGTPTVGSFGNIQLNVAAPEVTNWTYDSPSDQVIMASNGAAGVTLTISDTLTKQGSGTLTFRASSNGGAPLTLSVGALIVEGGSLNLGDGTNPIAALTVGSATVSSGALRLNVAGSATITGAATLGGTGSFLIANRVGDTRTVSVGSLSSASSTAVVAANDFGSSVSTGTLILTASSGTATYAGIVRNGASTSTLSVVKNGAGTQIFSGNGNIYNGGTTVNAGTLLVNNASGSGTGTGAVTVTGGTLGGTGIIAPTGVNGISVADGGFFAPGASIGTLTINLAGTTGIVNLTSGGDFKFELGVANADIGSIAVGSSDLLVISGAVAGDVAFGGGNTIDLLGTATGEGYYKLFDTTADEDTWTGLTLGGATTGGTFITGGLTATNFGGGFSGNLILADGTFGTSAGDIYLQVIPEPSALLLAAMGLGAVAMFRRPARR